MPWWKEPIPAWTAILEVSVAVTAVWIVHGWFDNWGIALVAAFLIGTAWVWMDVLYVRRKRDEAAATAREPQQPAS